MVTERGIERRQEQVIRAYQQGSEKRWVACLAASRIVGNYDRGATQALARELALSVDQVENLARAGVVYRWMRPFDSGGLVRKKLTPGHYSAIGQLIKQFDLPLWDAFEDLRTAANEGISIAGMRASIVDREGGGVYWEKRYRRIRNDLAMLLTDSSVPREVLKRAKRASRFIR